MEFGQLMTDILVNVSCKFEMYIFKNAQVINVNVHTPQPLYNTIVGVQANFRVSFPIRVITRVKCIVKKENHPK